MKREYNTQGLLRLLSLPLMLVALASCTKEDMTDCSWIPAQLKVVVRASPDDDMGEPAAVNGVLLHIFDENGFFICTEETRIGEIVQLNYPEAKMLEIVAVANHDENNECVVSCTGEGHISGGNIALLEQEIYDEMQVVGSPSDLFFGSIVIANDGRCSSGTCELPVARMAASVNLTIRNLHDVLSVPVPMHREAAAQIMEDDLCVVFSTYYNQMDFSGSLCGNPAGYKQYGAFNDASEFLVPSFNMLSSSGGEPVELKVYYQGKLIDTITKDQEGNALKTVSGKYLNILIDYEGFANVTVSVTPWGEMAEWEKEFGS